MVNVVCPFLAIVKLFRHSLITSLVCPANFRGNHRYPVVNQVLTLRTQRSDTINEAGISLNTSDPIDLERELFCGWIRRRDIVQVQGFLDEAIDRNLVVTVWDITRQFRWYRGGGNCLEGRITIVFDDKEEDDEIEILNARSTASSDAV